MESLSSESKLLYDMIMSETEEIYEAKFASYRARALAGAVTATSTTRSSTTLSAPSGTASRGYCDEPASATSSPTSSQGSSTTKSTTTSIFAATPTHVPAAAPLNSTTTSVLAVTTTHEANLCSMTPTTCSSECPSDDAHASVSVDISSPTPNSVMATCSVVPELASPLVSDKALDLDTTGAPDHSISKEDPMDMSLTPGNSPSLPREQVTWSPASCSTECSGRSIETLSRLQPESYKVFNIVPTVTAIAPWPPPPSSDRSTVCLIFNPHSTLVNMQLSEHWQVLKWSAALIMITVIPGVKKAQPKPIVLAPGASSFSLTLTAYLVEDADKNHRTEIKLPPWPPPWSKGVQNIIRVDCQDMTWLLRTTLFPLHVESVKCIRERFEISSNLQVLRVVVLEWNATFAVIDFAFGVLCAQMITTMFKLLDILCLGTRSVVARTNVDMRLELLLVRRATCTLQTWCCLDILNCSLGNTTLAISEWDMLNPYLETWVLRTCHFARVHFQWTLVVQRSTSSSRFLVILIGKAKVHHHYSCTMVLADAVLHCFGILHEKQNLHILEFSELLLQYSSFKEFQSESFPWCIAWFVVMLLLPSLGLCLTAAENYAMLQYLHSKGPQDIVESDWVASRYFVVAYIPRLEEWQPSACIDMLQTHKIYSTKLSSWKGTMLTGNQWILMRWKLSAWMVLDGYRQVCVYARVVTQGRVIQPLTRNYSERFPIVIFLAHSALDINTGCDSINVGCSTWMKENVPNQLQGVYNMLGRLTGNLFPAALFVIEQWLLPWDPCDVLVQYLQSRIRRWIPTQLDDSPGHHPVENSAPLAITCELHCYIIVVDTLLAARFWVCSMRTVKLHIGGPGECVSFLQPKPPWSHLAPTMSTSELRSNMMIVSEPLYTTGINFQLNLLGSATWYMLSARFRPPESYCVLVDLKNCNDRDMSCWNYPLPSTDHVQNDGFQGVFLSDCITASCFRIAKSKELTQGHAADEVGTLFRANKTFNQWRVPNYNKFCEAYPLSAHLPFKSLQLSWDPGDCSASVGRQDNPGRVNDVCSCPDIDTSQTPWDPGGSLRDRLGGKPDFKGGGLSATILLYARHRWWADTVGTRPAKKLLQIEAEVSTRRLAWNGIDGLGLEGEDRLAAGALGVCLNSSSSSEFSNLLEFFL